MMLPFGKLIAPTGRIERTLTKLTKTDWPDNIKTSLTPRASVSPRLYGPPEIHKEGCPLHPIVKLVNVIGIPYC